jgi:hypothetical protein
LFPRGFTLTYDVYLTNGLGEGIVLNEHGRTRLASGKGEGLVAEDNNGRPSISGRLGFRRNALGELGLSYYGGPYNTYRSEGVQVDERRDVHLAAIDLTTEVGSVSVRSEMAFAWIEVPNDLREVFGNRQWGFHVDAVVPLWRPRIRALTGAVVNGVLRLERVDYNRGTFTSTGASIGDEVTAVVTGATFHPAAGTVLKANYRREWIRDLQGNVTVNRAGFQFGLATYF